MVFSIMSETEAAGRESVLSSENVFCQSFRIWNLDVEEGCEGGREVRKGGEREREGGGGGGGGREGERERKRERERMSLYT